LIIALAIPAYRQQVNVQTAYCWAQDAMTAMEMGWKPALIWVDNSGIARARNTIVAQAEKQGARLLLMCDSDTFATPMVGSLGHMWQTMQEHSAAVVGAAVVTRNGQRVNCEPVHPGETYEGEVGTGLMLVDLWKLRDLPKPWFVHRDTPDGLKVECGEDIYFCRHAKAHGHSVVVNYALPTGHADQHVAKTAEIDSGPNILP
jgi:hypothetical protein